MPVSSGIQVEAARTSSPLHGLHPGQLREPHGAPAETGIGCRGAVSASRKGEQQVTVERSRCSQSRCRVTLLLRRRSLLANCHKTQGARVAGAINAQAVPSPRWWWSYPTYRRSSHHLSFSYEQITRKNFRNNHLLAIVKRVR